VLIIGKTRSLVHSNLSYRMIINFTKKINTRFIAEHHIKE